MQLIKLEISQQLMLQFEWPSEKAFFLSRIAFCLIKKCGHIHELQAVKSGHFVYFMACLLKIAVFSPMLLANKGLFLDQTKCYCTWKKRLFQMAYFKFHEKNYWESSKLTNLKINPSRENHAHFISCKPPYKNHPREYFGTTLWSIQIATSVVEKSHISSVAFHLSTTVWSTSWQCNFDSCSVWTANLLTSHTLTCPKKKCKVLTHTKTRTVPNCVYESKVVGKRKEEMKMA